jgi:hypothetical protein
MRAELLEATIARGVKDWGPPGLEAVLEIESKFIVQGDHAMRKIIPSLMFASPEQSRLTTLRNWVLENAVTEISMVERQFWNFAGLQPVAEKPWATFMGRPIFVPDMPVNAQKCLGIFDKRGSAPHQPEAAPEPSAA